MRVALVAHAAGDGQAISFAGRPIAWHQIQSALALGCERIICLAETPGPALASLQRETEGRGIKFHAIAHHRALSGLVSAADTLFVFAPAVLPDRAWLEQMLASRAGVAVLPADRAVERGFERIDRERAWAGVLATRGDAVEALAALPHDADPIAGLLRVALQKGSRPVEVPEGWLDDGRWVLLADSAAAHKLESDWQDRHVPSPAISMPGEALAHRAARAFQRRAGEAQHLATATMAGGGFVALIGAVTGYLGHTLAGMAALTVGAFVSIVGERLGMLRQAGTGQFGSRLALQIRDAALDAALIIIAASPREFSGWPVPFAAAVLVLAMRLAWENDRPAYVRSFSDRTLLLAVLTLAAAAGFFPAALASLSLAALAAQLFWRRARG